MKQKIFLIISILLMAISIINIKPSFSSDKTIYFDAKSKTFTYYNINKNDLFDEFKNLIPGDIKEQNIKIKVINNNTHDMYMKINFNENKDIINNLIINVYKNDNEVIKNNEIYKIAESKDNEINLKIKLEVPTSLGNEISNYSNNFKIAFYIEDNNELVEVPKTYEKNIYIYYLLLFISLIIMLLSCKKMLKKEK